jgi:hypothetical protein
VPFAISEHQTAELSATVRPAPVIVKTASYTAVLTDANHVIEFNSGVGTTLTIPPDSTTTFAVGVVIGVYRHGTGSLTIAPGAGVTIRSAGGVTGSRTISSQFGEASLRKRAANDWVLVGNLT